MINETIRQHILRHIHDESPNEVCGLVIVFSGRQLYIRCSNIASDPLVNFEIDPIEWKNAEDKGQILAVVHSHPGDVSPSDRDRQCAEEVGLPWLIINSNNELYELVPDSYCKPFVGREFCWGVNDCWSLVWDWFKRERDIELMDMERPEPDAWLVHPEEWLSSDDIDHVENQFTKLFSKYYYLGTFPIDFDKKSETGKCLVSSLCSLDLKRIHKNGFTQIGIIFNTDVSSGPGKHWV